MGFYDNHKKAFFQFDRVFNSRYEMDEAVRNGVDEIFVGHFVLVEYSPDGFGALVGYANQEEVFCADIEKTHPYVYTDFSKVSSQNLNANNWDTYFYFSNNKYFAFTSDTEYDNADKNNIYVANHPSAYMVQKNTVVKVITEDLGELVGQFVCVGGVDGEPPEWLSFENLEGTNIENLLNDSYLQNYLKDKRTYGNNFDIRGYDATIWAKVFSEGQGRFILIARMNGEVPGFSLTQDAPSQAPSAPYIGRDSSNRLYSVHVPTHWGFRIKQADGVESGGQTTYPLSDEYIDQKYCTITNNVITGMHTEHIPAEIYFNKNGFVRAVRHYDTMENEILIKPTGQSGKVYYNENGDEITLDTYELSIHLPVIGNIISDFYDKFYGTNRKLDTNWYEGDNDYKETGSPSLNGKQRDLDTVAGLINTVQDRLGQNIITVNGPLNDSNITGLDTDYIYAYTNPSTNVSTYYRIGYGYDYTPITDSNQISYTKVDNLTEAEYAENNYYYKNQGQYIPCVQSYNYYITNNLDAFYMKNITNERYERVNLTNYQAKQFYYKEGNNYIVDTETVPSSYTRPYYTITNANLTSITFSNQYQPGLFYTKVGDRYTLVTEETPDPVKDYYSLTITAINNGARAMLYRPNVFYYYQTDDGRNEPGGKPILDTNSSITEGRYYWQIPMKDTLIYVYDSESNRFVVGYELDVSRKSRVSIFWPGSIDPEDIYAKINDTTYAPLSNLPDNTVEYIWYQITSIERINSFFIPGVYYQQVLVAQNAHNYEIANSFGGSSAVYYTLHNIEPVQYPFYRSHKYYYYNESNNLYEIDESPTMIDNRIYYIGHLLYVYEDSSERWPFGFLWPEHALYVPASVTLANREEKKKAYELVGINNGRSSINGTLLELNNIIDEDNVGTRNNSTFTGSINSAKDILASFNLNLIPGRILYVNDFGQLEVSSIKISDLESLINGD